jgi:hypothetical protein
MSSCYCQYECSCQDSIITTTTTTTTVCPDAIFCDEVYNLNCVVYSGCENTCPQIKTGDSLIHVFSNIFRMINQC